MARLSRPFRLELTDHRMQVLQPRGDLDRLGLGWSPFARHYLGSHYCFLFLRVLRCFSSPGWPRPPMFSAAGDRSSTCRVFPFGHPRINEYLPLPTAYRSLSRPSSPSRAKASTMCSFLLVAILHASMSKLEKSPSLPIRHLDEPLLLRRTGLQHWARP